jgi:hypothetical protein
MIRIERCMYEDALLLDRVRIPKREPNGSLKQEIVRHMEELGKCFAFGVNSAEIGWLSDAVGYWESYWLETYRTLFTVPLPIPSDLRAFHRRSEFPYCTLDGGQPPSAVSNDRTPTPEQGSSAKFPFKDST